MTILALLRRRGYADALCMVVRLIANSVLHSECKIMKHKALPCRETGGAQLNLNGGKVMRIKIAVLSAMLFSGSIIAAEPLSGDAVKALISDKTFDVRNEQKGKDLVVFDSADGRHLVYIPWKDKVSKRKWWLDGNKHCTSHPKRGDSCKDIVPAGNGVYHGITDGKHTHTLKNFRDGKQLKN